MAELTFDTSGAGLGVPVMSGDGIYYYDEIGPESEIEVLRVISSVSGDYLFSRKFQKIKAIMIQNHGATFDAGVSVDPPQVEVTQGTATSNAMITITHTATAECFSIFVWGEL